MFGLRTRAQRDSADLMSSSGAGTRQLSSEGTPAEIDNSLVSTLTTLIRYIGFSVFGLMLMGTVTFFVMAYEVFESDREISVLFQLDAYTTSDLVLGVGVGIAVGLVLDLIGSITGRTF